MTAKVGIVGAGFVGTACETGFLGVAEVRIHDKYKPSESLKTVVSKSDILFFCLPTPMNEDGSCNASILEEVVLEAAELANNPKIFVVKSTVPPGTTDSLQTKCADHKFCFNPEFLTEKNFIGDFLNQDRIILGWSGKIPTASKLHELYGLFVKSQSRPGFVVNTNAKSAEMLKYTTNCFLATKVIFFNEINEICNEAKINYGDVVSLLTLDNRIGATHLAVPGPDGKHGFSGKCFPKDLNSLIFFAKSFNLDPILLESVWTKNLLLRDPDWEDIPGAVSSNMDFSKNR